MGASTLIWALIGFISGAIPFSALLARRFAQQDIRRVGDGNPGASNAWRAGGWRVGVLALVLDFLKGALPVGIARFLVGQSCDLDLETPARVAGAHSSQPAAIETFGTSTLNDWLVSLQNGILIFLLTLFLIGLTNLRFLRRIERYGTSARFPRVAVLVPARNEAANIGVCIRSLLAQDYAHFEIIALDDHSTDRTGAMLAELAAADPRLRVLAGKPLPPDWLGKHWACHQLVQATDAELILFTDADTRHHPHALGNAVAALLREEAALITALPREHAVTWGEKLIVPLFPWSVFYFLPLGLAHRMAIPPLSATSGQFMLFRRSAYEAIGGHAGVRRHAADDLALGRRIIAHNLRWRLVDGVKAVECRMYRNWREAFDGFGKNLFAAFDYKPWLFVPIWLWLGIVFLAPLLVALSGNVYAGGPPVALSLVLWAMFYRRFHFPLYLTLFYPLTLTIGVLLAFRSMALTATSRAVWKGRVIARGPSTEGGR